MFEACESIRFLETNVNNCELLGIDVTRTDESPNITEGVFVARDVTLFTEGFAPDSAALLTIISNVFDLDECRAICEEVSS